MCKGPVVRGWFGEMKISVAEVWTSLEAVRWDWCELIRSWIIIGSTRHLGFILRAVESIEGGGVIKVYVLENHSILWGEKRLERQEGGTVDHTSTPVIDGDYIPRPPVDTWNLRLYWALYMLSFFLYIHTYDKD